MDNYAVYNDENFNTLEYFLNTDLPRLSFYFTLFLIPIGIGACIMCISQTRNSLYPKNIRRFFLSVSASVIVYLTSHFFREILLEFRWNSLRIILPIISFAEFLTSGIIVFIISVFILHNTGSGK